MGVAWGGVALTVFFIALRVYDRPNVFRRIYTDDGLVFFAWIVLLINTIIWQERKEALYENIAVSTGQLYPPPADFAYQTESYLRSSNVVIVFFYTGLWSVKLSFLVFFKPLGQNVRNQLPINILWRVKITVRKNVALAGIFSLTVFIMVFAVVRVAAVGSHSPQPDQMWLHMWSSIEQTVSIIIACLASYRTLFTSSSDRRSKPIQDGSPKNHSGEASHRTLLFGISSIRDKLSAIIGNRSRKSSNEEHAMESFDIDDDTLLDYTDFEHGAQAKRDEFCQRFHSALSCFGFVRITNHTIPDDMVDKLSPWSKLKAAHPRQPNPHRGWSCVGQEKLSVIAQGKAVFDLNNEEADLPGFRAFMEEFYECCHDLHLRLLSAIALSMSLPPAFFAQVCGQNRSELRLNYYPSAKCSDVSSGNMRISSHTDFGTITLLFQDCVGGLEIEEQNRKGSYIPIAASSRTEMIVNVGDCLQRWTNDHLRSANHRVTLPVDLKDSPDGTVEDRFSVAYFGKPNRDVSVRSLPALNKLSYEWRKSMAGWKVRGYVADSEEEEDSQSNKSDSQKRNGHELSNVQAFDDNDDTEISHFEVQGGRSNGLCRAEPQDSGVVASSSDAEVTSPRVVGSGQSNPKCDTSSSSQSTDELQQNHNQTSPISYSQHLVNKLSDVVGTNHKDLSPQRPPSSMPLTLPSSSPRNCLQEEYEHGAAGDFHGAATEGEFEVQERVVSGQDAHRSPLELQGEQNNRSTRNLRHRNPIQLHPYVIEGEKYRQILKGRGVKPLRIAIDESQSATALRDDSQARDFNISTESQDSLPRVGSQSSNSSSASHRDLALPRSQFEHESFNYDQDDLPDVEAVLRRMPPNVVPNGHKRRKVKQSYTKKHQTSAPTKIHRVSLDIHTSTTTGDEDPMFDIPPSPPPSQLPRSASSIQPHSRGFRFPRGISPITLPTPATSSEPRGRPTLVSEASQTETYSSVTESWEDERGSSRSEPEEGIDHLLEGVQRRIRGVLPASWLRLDLQAQAKKSKQDARHGGNRSPGRVPTPHRGIARPVTSRGKPSMDPAEAVNILDSSSDTGSEEQHQVSSPSRRFRSITRTLPGSIAQHDGDLPASGHLWGEVLEDNRIDTMAPGIERSRKRGVLTKDPKSKKRQTRLTDPHLQQGLTRVRRTPSSVGPRAQGSKRTTEQYDKPRKLKFRPPNLSLLDVPSLSAPSSGPVPSFIRVAQRTIRSRKDQGRSDPGRKYVRLATNLDTMDANESLRAWREGTLKPTTTAQNFHTTGLMPLRAPLQPCAGNLRSGRNSKSQSLKLSRSRVKESSLDHILRLSVQDDSPAESRETKQLHQNGARSEPQQGPSRIVHIESSLKNSESVRPATLESIQANADRDHPQSAFRRRLNRSTRETLNEAAPNPLLARFLGDGERSSDTMHIPNLPRSPSNATLDAQIKIQRHRPRKRRARRVDVQTFQVPDAGELTSKNEDKFEPRAGPGEGSIEKAAPLIGLPPFGTTYTTTFGINPLPAGSCFNDGTLLGSGDFAKSFINSDLDKVRGFSNFQYRQATFRLGPWSDTVSTQLDKMIDDVCLSLQEPLQQHQQAFQSALACSVELLRNIMRYFSNSLSFYDAIDRTSFLERCNPMVSRLFLVLTSCNSHQDVDTGPGTGRIKRLRIQAASLCTIIASQLRQISSHHVVPQDVRTKLRTFLENIVAKALNFAADEEAGDLAECIISLQQSQGSSITLDERHASIELLVLANHVLSEDNSLKAFWHALQALFIPPMQQAHNDVRILEKCWTKLFHVLPFLEFDKQGVLEVGRRYRISTENWAIANGLLEPVLKVYQPNASRQASTINDYCRALFGRCLGLINFWGWRKCESNIGVLFDFFARRNLSHLPNEESHGSPAFLAHLDQQPSLNLAPEDRSFQIFLKIIGSGVRQMQKVYPSKKIRDIVWRLMPNHGRFLPKDQAIHQTDLDALRNHHDLLCTLYWASPQGFRPKPTVVQNLVDVENSHKEACRINIRAWSNIVMFQLTAEEALTNLSPFVTWYSDLQRQLLHQHESARVEAEEQVHQAESTEGFVVNRSLLESTVAQNQRQVEGLLNDALLSMKNAVSKAPNCEGVKMLLFPDLLSALRLFITGSPHTNKVIYHTLEVFLTVTTKTLPERQIALSRDDGDESQDYGDWSAFDTDALASSSTSALGQYLEKHFQSPLRQLLSDCFGADKPSEDTLLTKIIEAWVAIGRISVLEGSRTWNDYIGEYGQDSWSSLRDTEQTRKFSPYYLATLIDAERKIFKDYKQSVLKAWTASLVERESLLKYQHQLTSSLLEADLNDPVLVNPPLWKTVGRFDIALTEFSKRRLSLISTLLSNMRKSVEEAENASNATDLKANFKEILKVMMSRMKKNYQELGQGPNVRGAYVDFVHRIVELLQQHTSSICPVDRYFTDSNSFPLPATDPTYVVGQLKNYGLRLRDHRISKQLAVFVQSVSERAAGDGQQVYLVDQLHSAMAHGPESELCGRSNLRSFLMINVFPAYIDLALSTACGWIVALPVLQAIKLTLGSILGDVDGADDAEVASVMAMLLYFLGCLRRPMDLLLDHPGLMEQPRKLKVLTTYYSAVTALIPALDYLCRVTKSTHHANTSISWFKSFALFAAQLLLEHTDVEPPSIDGMEEAPVVNQYGNVQAFALHELRESLNKNWTCHDERYYVSRGQSRREVVVDLGLFEEEKRGFIEEAERFLNALERMTVLRDG
ncbi:MAG: hypothetical protein Q9181_003464 [Wetmoreana brouardii]